MKLIAIDMDGTLLNSAGHISAENRQGLEDFVRTFNGVIAVCSARPLVTLFRLLADQQVLHLVRYIAGFNGCQLFDNEENKIVFERLMTSVEVCDVNSGVNLNHYAHHFFTRNEIKHSNLSGISTYSHYEANAFDLPLNCYPLAEIYSSSDIYKITVCGDASSIPLFQQIISRQLPDGLSCMATGENYIDIQPSAIDKGSAIERIKANLKLAADDVVAIGDQQNDLPMFKAAGTTIAMDNAVQMLKDQADMITLHHDRHGVAHAIQRLLSR